MYLVPTRSFLLIESNNRSSGSRKRPPKTIKRGSKLPAPSSVARPPTSSSSGNDSGCRNSEDSPTMETMLRDYERPGNKFVRIFSQNIKTFLCLQTHQGGPGWRDQLRPERSSSSSSASSEQNSDGGSGVTNGCSGGKSDCEFFHPIYTYFWEEGERGEMKFYYL
jgi:hypothetical protein